MAKFRHAILLLMLFAATFKCYGQNLHLDSMPDLYIITIDKTGSMLWDINQKYQYSRITTLATEVTERIKNSNLFVPTHFKRDRFLFFYSGTVEHSLDESKNLPGRIRYTSNFESSLIHHTDSALHAFNQKDDLVANIFSQLDTGRYNFEYSFVSQLRLFSLIKGLDYIKGKRLTNAFNHIFLLMVTDDEDQNDLWMKDYKTVHKYAPAKIKEVNYYSDRYLFNPFNENTDLTKSGVFYNRYSDEHESPYLNLYEYKTSQESPKFSIKDGRLVGITADSPGAVNVAANRTEYGKDPISFFHVDSIFVNGIGRRVNADLNRILKLPAKLKGGFNSNSISVSGYFQVNYRDTLLGQRPKIIKFSESQELPSILASNIKRAGILLIIVILLTATIKFFLVTPNEKFFVLYDSLGNEFRIRKGQVVFGGSNRWKQGDNALLYYFSDQSGLFFLKSKNKNIKQQKISVSGSSFSIVIKSRIELTIDCAHEQFKPSTDIPEYHEGRNFDPLLEFVYERSIKYKFLQYLRGIKRLKRTYRRAIGKRAIKLTGMYYYLIQFEEIEKTIISISAKRYRNKTFTIETGPAKKIQEAATNDDLIKFSVKDHYFSRTRYADSLIIINYLPGAVTWNVLKLEYRNRLSYVYQLLQFEQAIKSGNFSMKLLERNASILRRHMLKSSTQLKRAPVYFNNVSEFGETLSLPSGWRSLVFSGGQIIPDLTFKFSSYPSFLYLSQTKNVKNRELKVLYSPFLNGNDLETITQSPTSGNFHLYNALAPELIDGPSKNPHVNQLANDIFSFSSMKDILLKIDIQNNEITYDDQIINLNDNQL